MKTSHTLFVLIATCACACGGVSETRILKGDTKAATPVRLDLRKGKLTTTSKNLLPKNASNGTENGLKSPFYLGRLALHDTNYTVETIASNSNNVWEGSSALLYDGQGFNSEGDTCKYTGPKVSVTLEPNTMYTFSVYGTEGAPPLQAAYMASSLCDYGQPGATYAPVAVATSTNYNRSAVTFDSGPAGDCELIVVNYACGYGYVYLLDGFQLEEGSTATSWVAGD